MRNAAMATPAAAPRFQQAPGGSTSIHIGSEVSPDVVPASRGPVGGADLVVLGTESAQEIFDARQMERAAVFATPDARPRFSQAPGGTTSICMGLEGVFDNADNGADQNGPVGSFGRGPVGGEDHVVLGGDDRSAVLREHEAHHNAWSTLQRQHRGFTKLLEVPRLLSLAATCQHRPRPRNAKLLEATPPSFLVAMLRMRWTPSRRNRRPTVLPRAPTRIAGTSLRSGPPHRFGRRPAEPPPSFWVETRRIPWTPSRRRCRRIASRVVPTRTGGTASRDDRPPGCAILLVAHPPYALVTRTRTT